MKTVLPTFLWRSSRCFDFFDFIVFKRDLSFDNEIKLVCRFAGCVYFLISVVLLEFEELEKVPDFFAQRFEDWEALDEFGHFVVLYSCAIDVVLSGFGILNLNIDSIFCNKQL